MSNMLGSALAEIAGPLKDFFEKLQGNNAERWVADFKKFLRKEERNLFIHIVLKAGVEEIDEYAGPFTRVEALVWLTENGFELDKDSVEEFGYLSGGVIETTCFYHDGKSWTPSVDLAQAVVLRLDDPECTKIIHRSTPSLK